MFSVYQGQFRESLTFKDQIVGATKWCVFKRINPTRAVVQAAVQERMERMRTTSIDLLQVRNQPIRHTTHPEKSLQFHWQDYTDNGYITALNHLLDLKMEGTISAIGLCNFDTIRTDEICTELGPGAIVSNQVQVFIR